MADRILRGFEVEYKILGREAVESAFASMPKDRYDLDVTVGRRRYRNPDIKSAGAFQKIGGLR